MDLVQSWLAYHAGAIAVVTVLHFGAWLVPFAIAALAGVIDVHHNLLVNTLCGLIERQLHDVLGKEGRDTVSNQPQPSDMQGRNKETLVAFRPPKGQEEEGGKG